MTSPNIEPVVTPPTGLLGRVWNGFKQSVGSPAKKILSTGSALIIVTYAGQRVRQPNIVLVPVALPQKLAESGLSGSELTERLLDRIQALREAAEPTASESGWGIEKNVVYPDIDIGGVKWSFSSLKELFDGFGHQAQRVTWAISARPRDAAPGSGSWIVTASTTGGHLHQQRFRPDDPDSALSAIAVAILEDVEPNVAIRMHRFRGECDEARRLAIREYHRPHTATARSSASNMMGFVWECPFAKTGANGDQAEAFYRQAIALDSMNAQAHSNLARLLADRGDSADVWRRHFEQATSRGPEAASTYEAWGNALLLNGDVREAVKKLEHAVAIDPSSATARLSLGGAYLFRGDTSRAIDELGTALLQQPDAAGLSQYASLLMQRRRWVAAADAYRRASDLEEDNLEMRFRLGVALDSGARKTEARAVFLALAEATTDTTPYCNGAKRYVPDLLRCGHPAKLR